MEPITDMLVGMDKQNKVHIQVFFQEGVTNTAWKMGWSVVGQRPNWGLGLYFEDPKNPGAVIRDVGMLRSIVMSIMNEGGYHCDTYIGKPKLDPQGQNTLNLAKPIITQWVTLDQQQRVFFQTLLQWLP